VPDPPVLPFRAWPFAPPARADFGAPLPLGLARPWLRLSPRGRRSVTVSFGGCGGGRAY